MKTNTLGMLLVIFISACSHNTEMKLTTSSPEFSIAPGDVIAAPVINPADSIEGIVDVHFTGQARTEFIKFSQAHRDQQVQFLFDKQKIGTAVIDGTYTPGAILVRYPTIEEAKKVAALLTAK